MISVADGAAHPQSGIRDESDDQKGAGSGALERIPPWWFICAAIPFVVAAQGVLRQEYLWLDETISVSIAQQGFWQIVQTSTTFQGQSPLYFLLLAPFVHQWGSSPQAVRFLSVLGVVIGAFGLWWWCRETKTTRSFPFAIALLGTADPVLRALSARPYGLAFGLAMISFPLCLRMIRRPTREAALGYLSCLLILTYLHYLFIAVVLVHAVVLLLSEIPERARAWRYAIAAWVGTFVGLFPTAMQLLALLQRRGELGFSVSTTLPALLQALSAGPVLMLTVISLAVGLVTVPRAHPVWSEIGREWRVVALVWWAAVPTVVWLKGYLTGWSLFVDRYFVWYVAGLAWGAGLLLASLTPPRGVKVAFIALVGFACFHEVVRSWREERWRDVAHEVAGEGRPVLLYSGLIESGTLSDELEPGVRRYLNMPLTLYAPQLAPIPLPQDPFGERAVPYLAKSVFPLLATGGAVDVVLLEQEIVVGGETTKALDRFLNFFTVLKCSTTTPRWYGQVARFSVSGCALGEALGTLPDNQDNYPSLPQRPTPQAT